MPKADKIAISRAEPLQSELSRWAGYAVGIRDSVMGLPPIPAILWIGGLALLLIVTVLRIGRSMQMVRVAKLAPPSVVNMVASASEQLELRRAPLTLMTDRAVSPMLWCGRHVYLILPRQLWEQLDEAGRQAVVYHELAHLRRRDHWVCWAELIVGWLYWWNPVVWFVRQRLREEADLCCDAWVTALLPTDRRAYAQALLDTRKYTSVTQPAVPSVGLGVTTKRAKRFARRLTMVMTEHVRPRLSMRGLTLACALAVGGFIVTPLWACPPSEKGPKSEKVNLGADVRAPKASKARRRAQATQPESDETTFGQFMQGRDRGELQKRLHELERQLERMNKEVHERVRKGIEGRRAPRADARRDRAPHAAGPHPFALAAPPSVPQPPAPPSRIAFAPSGNGDACCEKVVTRSYKLSEGKLAALTDLMRRDDVPILMRPGDDGIEVIGNQAQHMIFGAFVKMIDGKDQTKSYELSEGKLSALTELMSRADVPIIIERGDDSITVHGTDLEQAIFGAFVKMISGATKVTQAIEVGPGADASARRWADVAKLYEREATQAYRPGAKQWAEAAAQLRVESGKAYRDNIKQWAQMAEQFKGQAGQAQAKQLEQVLRSVERQIARTVDRAARMADNSVRIEELVEALTAKAEVIAVEASELDSEEFQRELNRKIEQIMERVQQMLKKAEVIENEAEAAEDQADALQDHADELREVIEAIVDTEVASRGR